MSEQQKPGSIVHVEIPTNNPARTKKFYGEVFGWTFQDLPEVKYTLFSAPSGPAGGLREPLSTAENRPLNYILVNSVEDATRKIRKAGGKILRHKDEVVGQGWWALFEDPTGTVNAVWENNPRALKEAVERQP